MDIPNDNILLPLLSLDFMPTFIPQQYVGFGAARCDDTVSASGLSACDIFQCVVYDPPGLSRPGYDDSVSVFIPFLLLATVFICMSRLTSKSTFLMSTQSGYMCTIRAR